MQVFLLFFFAGGGLPSFLEHFLGPWVQSWTHDFTFINSLDFLNHLMRRGVIAIPVLQMRKQLKNRDIFPFAQGYSASSWD